MCAHTIPINKNPLLNLAMNSPSSLFTPVEHKKPLMIGSNKSMAPNQLLVSLPEGATKQEVWRQTRRDDNRARARQKRVPPINRYSSPSSACDPPPAPFLLLHPPGFRFLEARGGTGRERGRSGPEGAGELCQGSCLRGALQAGPRPRFPLAHSLPPTLASHLLSLSLLSPSKIPFSLSSLLGPFFDLSFAPNTPVPAAEIPPRFPTLPLGVIISNLSSFFSGCSVRARLRSNPRNPRSATSVPPSSPVFDSIESRPIFF